MISQGQTCVNTPILTLFACQSRIATACPGPGMTCAELPVNDLGQKAGKLSGGQRAQLALTLAVAKRPELLLLDEPVASLDPLARREFLRDLMEAVAEQDLSVVLSSHLVADLERVCDYLIVLVGSRVRVAGP